MFRPHPWRHLAVRWPQVQVRFDLPTVGRWACVDWEPPVPVVRMRPDLTQVERRCSIAHETRHLERGPIVRGMRAREERIVCDLTARWLLPDVDQLRDAFAGHNLHQAAAHLWVTVSVLVDRLNNLADLESRHVHQFNQETA